MLSDLTFWDKELEAAMEAQLRAEHGPAAARFAAFRCLLLLAVTLRAWLSSAWVRSDLLFLAGAASNALPALAVSRLLPPHLLRPMQYGAIACDVLQAAIGCANHSRMAPASPGIGPWAALAYLPFGSTALWLMCYSTFSALPFHLELLKIGLVATVLLACSSAVCAGSAGLLAGYASLDATLRAAWRLLGPAGGSIASLPSVLAAAATCVPLAPEECGMGCVSGSADGGGLGISSPSLQANPQALVMLCVQYQTALILAAFLGTAWWVHSTQRRMRTRFLMRTAAAAGGGTDHVARLAAAASTELVGPQPDSGLDFLCLGVPAALCVLFAVSMSW